MRACVVKVYGRDVDVVKFYKDNGFDIIPPTLTINVGSLYQLGDVPANYALCRGHSIEALNWYVSIIVEDGDEFHAIPPACSKFY